MFYSMLLFYKHLPMDFSDKKRIEFVKKTNVYSRVKTKK